MKIWFAFLPLLLSPPIAQAGLKWDRERVELAPGPNEAHVDAKFGFVNNGKTPVTIEKLESSCGCTTASLSKDTYEPGERGEVIARFEIGQRRGLQTKSVTVRINGERQPTILTLIVSIPDLVKMNPGLLIWDKGDPNTPKKISIEAMPGQPVHILNVTSSDPKIRAQLETIKEGAQYAIIVRPESTEVAGFAVLTIASEVKGEKKDLRAYAQVKPPAR